jgi:hypothetical protein
VIFSTKTDLPGVRWSGQVFLAPDALARYHRFIARRMRCSDAGYAYHVLNRGVGRATIFYIGAAAVTRSPAEAEGSRENLT